MSSSQDRLPSHLKKYVVSQHYDLYTPEEQATWRYLLRQLQDFLSQSAHPCYLEGLAKTGISIEQIPKISEMDSLLQKFGWGAVPVSGFIPPAAFMEFQSLGILPIACDMRSLDHFLYTPAPDIVHEAAGHAPILIHPEYAAYLKSYAQVAKKAIISKEDLNQYNAIRKLSDLKENPSSKPEEIDEAERNLNEINLGISHVSEAALLSRMNWWTAEYGLVGSLQDPHIYGAGLLSSLGESRDCLKSNVKKIPLDVGCVETSYDITEPQPQLFVAPDFHHLTEVLDQFSQTMAYKRGGLYGLELAKKAQSVNTVELDSGLQISGVLESFISNKEEIEFLKFSGPSQLSFKDQQLPGHSKDFHSHGYSTPLGPLKDIGKALHELTPDELKSLGLVQGKKVHLIYLSGFEVQGVVESLFSHHSLFLVLSLKDCTVNRKDEVYFRPEWGQFDLACGYKVVSVFGGPADRESYGEMEDFSAERVPAKNFSADKLQLFKVYEEVASERKKALSTEHDIETLWKRFKSLSQPTWLLGLEIFELAQKLGQTSLSHKIWQELLNQFPSAQPALQDGARLAQEL